MTIKLLKDVIDTVKLDNDIIEPGQRNVSLILITDMTPLVVMCCRRLGSMSV